MPSVNVKAAQPAADMLKQPLRHSVEQMSVPNIIALIEFAQQTIQHKQKVARDALLAEFRERAATLGLSLKALIVQTGKSARPAKAKAGPDKLPAKFRGPSGEEWSGQGRTPTWLIALEAEGKKREDFAA